MPNSKGLARLAGIWCNDPVFLAWLEDVSGRDFNPDDAKEFVLLACGIASRSELDINEHAERAFNVEVRRPFLAWRNAHPDEVAKH
ncbi:hypothetical protein DBB29_03835 [Pandoraea cepalis]|uniref:Uncharacterized protein n=1 Tax=Pandoraea cepalis TaxID=2508294 RepID=A0AAW7MJF0_9BURK|nr:hypothetical protein [Pandoraea cepalis]MDN4572887.1 hypothetical protein [Pandoraea cepalis]MDN4577250.1 hypothetical protein [Pandoraea cepalis]